MFELLLVPWGSGAAWTLGIALKGTMVLLLVLLAAAALHRASAGLKHLVWSGGIVAVLLIPLVSVALPWELPVVPVPLPIVAPSAARPEEPVSAADASERESVASMPGGTDRSSEASSALSGGMLLRWLFAIWGAGVLFFLGRLGFGAMLLRRVVRGARPLDSPDWRHPLIEGADRLALARLPRLLTSDDVPMPVLCGVLRPAIVVPADALEWSERRRRAVLCHELAHIRRLDLPMNLLGRLACALHWVNPLVWVAARRLRAESERAADDLVLGVGTRPSEYADHLLQIVCGARHGKAPEVAIPMAQRREFEGRMLAILDRDARREPPSLRHTARLAVLALLLMLPIAAMGPAPAVSSEDAMEVSRPSESRSESESISPRMLAAILEGLEHTEASQRHDAANVLGTLRAAFAVGPLGSHLANDPDTTVRLTAAWALGQIADPEAIEPLGAAALGDVSEEVRGMAAWALGQVADPAAVPTLIAVLSDSNWEVRIRAAWAIGSIAPRSAPAGLIAALRDDEPQVRETAAWALGQAGDPSAVPGLAALVEELASKESWEAMWALTLIGGERARPVLSEALGREIPDVKLNDNIRRALAGDSVFPRPRPWPIPAIR